MAHVSDWRRLSREAIAAALAALPAGADDNTRRRALRDAYPFGERKYHPYRIWCSEVRRVLGLASPAGAVGPAPEVCLTADGPECGWCYGRGCLACSDYNRAWRERPPDRARLGAFLAALGEDPADPATRGVYADWLSEQGWDREAARVRQFPPLPAPAEGVRGAG